MEQMLVLDGGGTIRLTPDGPRVKIQVERPNDGRGLYKVWLYGAGGQQILLGTLMPEGSALKLNRSLSVGELERCGCWPLKGGRVKLAFSFSNNRKWYREQHPEMLVSDPILRGQIKGSMMCCREEEGFCLAVPFRRDRPVTLDAIFCLGRVELLEGTPYMIWRFNKRGRPMSPG